jgi:hypothetical protein
MTVGGNVIRGERFKLAWAPEVTYGLDPGTAAYADVFGVVQSATMPDPQIDIAPVYALGTASNRNPFIYYKQRMSLSGAVPDIWLLNGYPLFLAIGRVSSSGGPVYTHTISETTTLPSISIHVSHLDSTGTVKLMRRYSGGKVGRMSISAQEGEFLKCSLEDIGFLNWSHDQNGEPGYSAAVADINPAYPETTPYLFSMGSLVLNGQTFARIRNFSLEVNNNMEARYYVTNNGGSQLPYEYREGKRDYRFSCQVDISDATLYKELARQGTYNNIYKGFQIIVTFTRGTGDTITMTMPPTTPAAGGDAMGCLIRSAPHNIVDAPVVTVGLDIIVRSVGMVVTDAIATYPGNSSRYIAEFTANIGQAAPPVGRVQLP